MSRATFRILVASLLLGCSAHAEPPLAPARADAPHQAGKAHAIHWSYEGEGGPTHWGDLSSGNAACKIGHEQSPIDLAGAFRAALPLPEPAWTPVRGGIVQNNGHTIQMDLAGAGGIMIGGARFELKQFHFHHPSEHTIEGRSYPLEVHLVHAAANGQLAVVGVMFEEGDANPALDAVWATAPTRTGKAAVTFETDPAAFMPGNQDAFRYQGSLTTPPCSETVTWTVMATPLQASRAQIQAFAAMFPNNARPVQPLHRRYLLQTP